MRTPIKIFLLIFAAIFSIPWKVWQRTRGDTPDSPLEESMRRIVVKLLIIPEITCLLCLFLQPVPASAEMCFRPKPAPVCSAFWVTESGLGYMARGIDRAWIVSEIGPMFNLDERYAVGATSYIAYDGQWGDFRGGVKLRLRWWFNPGLSMNVSGGLILVGGAWDEEHPGFAGHLDLNYKDLVVPYIGLDVMRGGGLDGANWSVGLRFGSVVGLGISAVGAAVVAIHYLTRGLAD